MIELDFKAIGQRIATYRKMNGQTAQTLAAEAGAGLTREIMAKIETGNRQDVGVKQLAAIAWALGVPMTALLYPLEDPHAEIAAGQARPQALNVIGWEQAWPAISEFPPASPAASRASALLAALRSYSSAARRWNNRSGSAVARQGEMTAAEVREALAQVEEDEAIVEGHAAALRELGVRIDRGDDQ